MPLCDGWYLLIATGAVVASVIVGPICFVLGRTSHHV